MPGRLEKRPNEASGLRTSVVRRFLKESTMCYGYSSWFETARAKELRKAQEKIDAMKKQSPLQAPASPAKAPSEPVEQHEKIPA